MCSRSRRLRRELQFLSELHFGQIMGKISTGYYRQQMMLKRMPKMKGVTVSTSQIKLHATAARQGAGSEHTKFASYRSLSVMCAVRSSQPLGGYPRKVRFYENHVLAIATFKSSAT